MDLGRQDPKRKRFFDTIDLSPIAMLITDPTLPDNPIQLANPAFCALSGYQRSEVVGRNCRFMTGPATDPADSAEIKAAIHEGRSVLVEIVNHRRDGTAFRNGLMITPLFDESGKVRWFLGSQVDLGEPQPGSLAMRRADALRSVSSLSPRQREVLGLMARGLPSKQIASELKIGIKTVEFHRSRLLRSLGVRTSAEAVRMAIEARL